MVVYHSLGKTGWLTVVVNGTRQIPNGNFHGLLLFHFLNFFLEDRGCLLFTQKKRLVDSSKWDALNPEWKFPRGCACSIFSFFFLEDRVKCNPSHRAKTSKN